MVSTYLDKSLKSQCLNKPLDEQNLFALAETVREKNAGNRLILKRCYCSQVYSL